MQERSPGERMDGGGKLAGFSVAELDTLGCCGALDYMIVEADGAAGRSLKGHADYEPVVSGRADLVIAVIGIDCLGKTLCSQFVHRAELFARFVHKEPGSAVTADDIAAILLHEQGYIGKVEAGSRVVVFLSKVKSDSDRKVAGNLGAVIRNADFNRRIDRVVMGKLGGSSVFYEIVRT